jgi:hypothetical protein
VPKPVADALDVLVTVVLLLAAVGLLIAALGTGHAGLAWGSVVLSAVAAALILRRWRRSWLQRQDATEDELVLLLEDKSVDAEPGEQPLQPLSVTAAQEVEQGSASAEKDAQPGDTAHGGIEPGEEDTDAADLLVVYELTDEVLVVDEHPRYHLARCQCPDHARAERLPVREARELGFTPCDRCRPDTTLARKHRAARATAAGSS